MFHKLHVLGMSDDLCTIKLRVVSRELQRAQANERMNE